MCYVVAFAEWQASKQVGTPLFAVEGVECVPCSLSSVLASPWRATCFRSFRRLAALSLSGPFSRPSLPPFASTCRPLPPRATMVWYDAHGVSDWFSDTGIAMALVRPKRDGECAPLRQAEQPHRRRRSRKRQRRRRAGVSRCGSDTATSISPSTTLCTNWMFANGSNLRACSAELAVPPQPQRMRSSSRP